MILWFFFLYVRMEKRRGNYDLFCEKRRCFRNCFIDFSNFKRYGIVIFEVDRGIKDFRDFRRSYYWFELLL